LREAAGASIRLVPALWDIAGIHQEEARAPEPWVEVLADALQDIEGKIHNVDLYTIIGKPPSHRNQEDSRRLGEAMRELGWTRTRANIGGRVSIVYARGNPPPSGSRPRIYVVRDPLNGAVTAGHAPTIAAIAADTPGIDPPAAQEDLL